MLICTNDAFQLKLEFPSSQLELDPLSSWISNRKWDQPHQPDFSIPNGGSESLRKTFIRAASVVYLWLTLASNVLQGRFKCKNTSVALC